MAIELLLAGANGQPIVEGIPDEAITSPRDAEEPDGPVDFVEFDKDPNDLGYQRWALIVPDTPEGKRLEEIMAPLCEHRKEETERLVEEHWQERLKKNPEAKRRDPKHHTFRVPSGMTAEQAGDWWSREYHADAIDKNDRPLYLLILGDVDQISWEAQMRWSSSALVGRLAFPNDSGYEAYLHKLLAYERLAHTSSKRPRAAFYSVRDGTQATGMGHRKLMSPTVDAANRKFDASVIMDLNESGVSSPDDFLRAVADRDPTLLFTISHGLGTKEDTDEEERRRIQGAMSFGSGQKIMAEDVANRPFLPGGAWFFFACFSAGTPSDTAYRHWLQSLKEAGMNVRQSDIDAVLAALARKSPFVANLPQKALANPDGPLAVMGHVDLAWTFSFEDGLRNSRASRFEGIFKGIVDQSRIGCSFYDLQRVFNDANADLTDMLDTEERYRKRNETMPDAKTRPLKKAGLWMLRQDLAGYVLLGDPAARITALASPEEVRKVPSIVTKREEPVVSANTNLEASGTAENLGTAPNALATMDSERIEAAVFATVGTEAMDAIAKHFGVTRDALDGWINAYREGGRAAVRAKRND